MIGLTLFATAILTLGSVAVLYAVAMQDSALMPATVNPFSPSRRIDPSADTFEMSSASVATLNGDWNTNEVKTLREVEDMLDWLENHNVRHTELSSQNGKFLVRWR